MLLSAKTGRVRETTPLRRLSHKFEEMKNRVIIHRLPIRSIVKFVPDGTGYRTKIIFAKEKLLIDRMSDILL